MAARIELQRLLAAAALSTALAASAGAATITIVNVDGVNEGFNDPTPKAPLGGNPGTTVGAQRLYVFQYAANIWGAYLPSAVEIRVASQFSPQECTATGGVLGGASAGSSHRNFANAPFPDTWYQQSLANRLAGSDLSASNDINITFNSDIGKPTCLAQGWYYGVDGNEGSQIELLPVVLHELGHGLGFATITLAGVEMGTPPGPHVYDRFIFDKTQGMHWNEMTDATRGASTQNCSNVVWDGENVTTWSPPRLGPRPVLRVNAPAPVVGDYEVGTASFGPNLGVPGVTADVVLADDGTLPPLNSPSNACEPLINAGAIAGKIAMVDRGTCTFAIKVKNCQNAGAVGVIVADSLPGCPALGVGGADPTITIPVVRLTHDDGQLLKSQLGSGLNATLTVNPDLKAGSDELGRVLLYTPVPFAPGSSVSHFDISPTPHLLMEPAINTNLSSGLDLTRQQMMDIGWFTGIVDVPDHSSPLSNDVFLGAPRPNPASRGASVTFRISKPEFVRLAVMDVSGRRIRVLHQGVLPAGEHTRAWDGLTERLSEAPMGMYVIALRTSEGERTQRLALVR